MGKRKKKGRKTRRANEQGASALVGGDNSAGSSVAEGSSKMPHKNQLALAQSSRNALALFNLNDLMIEFNPQTVGKPTDEVSTCELSAASKSDTAMPVTKADNIRLNHVLRESRRKIDSLESLLKNALNKIKIKQASHNSLADECSVLCEENAQLKKMLAKQEAQIAAARERNKSHVVRIEQLTAECDKLQAGGIKKSASEYSNLKKCHTKQVKRNKALRKDNTEKGEAIESLSGELSSLKEKLTKLIATEDRRLLLTTYPDRSLSRLFCDLQRHLGKSGYSAGFYLKGDQQDFPHQPHQDIDIYVKLEDSVGEVIADYNNLYKIISKIPNLQISNNNEDAGYLTVKVLAGMGNGRIHVDLCFYSKPFDAVLADACRFTSGAGLTPYVKAEGHDGRYSLDSDQRLFSNQFSARVDEINMTFNSDSKCADHVSARRCSADEEAGGLVSCRNLPFAYLGSVLDELTTKDLPFLIKAALRAESRGNGVQEDLKTKIVELLSFSWCQDQIGHRLLKMRSSWQDDITNEKKKSAILGLFNPGKNILLLPEVYFDHYNAMPEFTDLCTKTSREGFETRVTTFLGSMHQRITEMHNDVAKKILPILLYLDEFYRDHLDADHWLVAALPDFCRGQLISNSDLSSVVAACGGSAGPSDSPVSVRAAGGLNFFHAKGVKKSTDDRVPSSKK